jgi:hypothetical protein
LIALNGINNVTVSRVFLDIMPKYLSYTKDNDADITIVVSCQLVEKLIQNFQDVFIKYFSHIISHSVDSPFTVIKGLVKLFNTCNSGIGRLNTVIKLLKVAGSSNAMETVLHMISYKWQHWITSCSLEKNESREFALAISDAFSTVQCNSERENERMLAISIYLFNKETNAGVINIKNYYFDVMRGISFILNSNYLFDNYFVGLKLLKQQVVNPDIEFCLELIELMVLGEVGLLLDSLPHRGRCKKLGISFDRVLDKTRVRSILTQRSILLGGKISYTDAARILLMDSSCVEEWIVRSSKAKLLSAKLDQVSKLIDIPYSNQLTLSYSDWNEFADIMRTILTAIDEIRIIISN